jgi:hypothetical protein
LAQAIVLICDQCGKPAESSVTIRVGAKNFVKDLCSEHLRALLKTHEPLVEVDPKVGTSTVTAAPKAAGRKRRGSKKPAAQKRAKRNSSRKGSRSAASR